MTLTLSQWKATMKELIDGVQGELGSGIPTETRAVLRTFRKRLDEKLSGRRRKRFEQELEAFLQSKRALRPASKRFLHKKFKAVTAALKRTRRLLARRKRLRALSS